MWLEKTGSNVLGELHIFHKFLVYTEYFVGLICSFKTFYVKGKKNLL